MSQVSLQPVRPFNWRALAAFILAPGVAALLAALVSPLGWSDTETNAVEQVWQDTLAYGLFSAYPATVILGLPAFLLLNKRLAPTLANCSFAGAVIAALPWALLLPILPHHTTVTGQPVADEWQMNIRAIGEIALLGTFGGALFWLIAAAGSKAWKASLRD